MAGELRERVAIVTGGGRGIGRAIALGYAKAGADVVISVARSPDEADAVVALGEALPGTIQAVQADVTVAADVDRLVQRALDVRGRIDVLVNNAARGMRFVNERFMTDPRPFWEADPVAWRMVIETNIVGVFLMSRAVVPHMLAAGGGSIINVTINQATMVRRGFSPYGPSKAALEAMTQRAGRPSSRAVASTSTCSRRVARPPRAWCRTTRPREWSCSIPRSSCRRRSTSRSHTAAASGSSPPSGTSRARA